MIKLYSDNIMYSVVCIVFFIFFFFKQKTAYEMRISDWSSDVCSSDLSVFPSLSDLVRIAVIGPELTDIFLLAARGPSDGQGRGRRWCLARRRLVSAAILIGRASCRERVCQYGEISAVAVSYTTSYRSGDETCSPRVDTASNIE